MFIYLSSEFQNFKGFLPHGYENEFIIFSFSRYVIQVFNSYPSVPVIVSIELKLANLNLALLLFKNQVDLIFWHEGE